MKLLIKMQRVLGSKWLYYCITAVLLIIFDWKILPYLVDNGIINVDLAHNLLSETFGLLFTLLVLVAIFELREELRWRKVKDKVLDRISAQLSSLFIQLTHFVEFEWPTNLYTILKELDSKNSLKFSEEGKNLLVDANLVRLLGTWIIGLRELEERYYRFLESRLELSLMETQSLLRRLQDGMVRYIDPLTKKFVSEDFQRKELLSIIHAMIHEIAKIRELGLSF